MRNCSDGVRRITEDTQNTYVHPHPSPPNHQVQLQLKHHYKLNAFSNPVDCALYTVRTKGPLGLYKGLTPWIVFAFPRSAVRFSTYEFAAQWLQGDGAKVDPLYAMLAGTLAGSGAYVPFFWGWVCAHVHEGWVHARIFPRVCLAWAATLTHHSHHIPDLLKS